MVFVFFYLSCIAIMDYPYLARIYNGRVQGKAVTEYEETIEKMDRNMWQEQLERAERYNCFLGSGTEERLEDPFGNTSQNHREYEELLNAGKEGIMGWIEIIRQAIAGMDNVRVIEYDNLTIDTCKSLGIKHIVRGVRNMLDFETERSIADANRRLAPEIETIIIPTAQEFAHISSTAVRDIIKHNGDASAFLPDNVKLQ